MTNPSTDVALLQLEVLKKIQAELGLLRGEVTSLRGDVTGLRTDLDTGLASVRNEVRVGLGEVRTELHDGLTRVRTEVAGLRGDMDVGFTAMRMQGDRRFLDHERRLRDLESTR